MSALDISEKRLPQDGRLQVRMKQRAVDVRVSLLPTMFGEKVVMRILDAGSTTPNVNKIGFEEEQLTLFRKAAGQPYGMILVTGPTGSGKSTTLYAVLNELNQPDVNISTVEDPVEYNMAGVNQTQMKDSIGMNFAAALRSLLRQDPDVIMVGEIEIRDRGDLRESGTYGPPCFIHSPHERCSEHHHPSPSHGDRSLFDYRFVIPGSGTAINSSELSKL